jgi:hypothetical protein
MPEMADIVSVIEPVLTGVGVIALPFAANAALQRLRLARLMPVVRRAFTVIDPLLNEYLRGYSQSDTRFALELVTAVLADGKLTNQEVRRAVDELERRYRPTKAAGKTGSRLSRETLEGKLLDIAADKVQSRQFGLMDAFNVAQVVRSSLK